MHYINFRKHCDIEGARNAAIRWFSLSMVQHGDMSTAIARDDHQLLRPRQDVEGSGAVQSTGETRSVRRGRPCMGASRSAWEARPQMVRPSHGPRAQTQPGGWTGHDLRVRETRWYTMPEELRTAEESQREVRRGYEETPRRKAEKEGT